MNLSTMTKDELLEQADVLELGLTSKSTVKELLSAIREALGETEVAETKEVEGDVQIMFANDQKNKQPVFFGLNGNSYRFPRGKWVRCPRVLLPTIELAKKRVQDEDGEWMEVDSYPYQVKGQ